MPKIIRLSLLLIFCTFFKMVQAASLEGDIEKFYCQGTGAQGECVIYGVSVINLIATPEKFHGKKVRVTGYLVISSDEIFLKLYKDATTSESVVIAIWNGASETEADIDRFNKKKREWKAKYSGRRVLIEGIFDMKARMRLVHGGIDNITRIQATY